MRRDSDKNNVPPGGRRARPTGGKGRSGASRTTEKKFTKRASGGAPANDKRAYAGKPAGVRSYRGKPGAGAAKPFAGKREGAGGGYGDAPRPARFNRDAPSARSGDRAGHGPRKGFRLRDGGSEKRPYTLREGSEKRPYAPRGEDLRTDGPRWRQRDGDRPQRDRPYGDRPKRDWKPSRGAADRGPRKDFGDRPDRGAEKPWRKSKAGPREDARRAARPPRDDGRNFDKPRFDRQQRNRPGFDRADFDSREAREDRPNFSRPREPRAGSWQEHPRSQARAHGFGDRPRRDNEDDAKIFAKRPAFGGRGAYRERALDPDKRISRPEPPARKAGERIAKLMARAGLASRRDAEHWVTQGRVTVNGRVINSPALDVTENDVVMVGGKPLPERERTRLFLYHKPRGLMTTHADPDGRPTVFDHLPEGLPRLISVGRLDFNTEGLLLLTNDGGLARMLELPDTGWLRRYRVRAHGEVTQAQLDGLCEGVEVDGVRYGPIDATLEHDKSANVWIVMAIREGKNREVRNILGHLGLEVNRLIRVSYGPFQLGELAEGEVDEVKTRVLREQLGDKIAALAGAEFARTMELDAGLKLGRDGAPLRPKKGKERPKPSRIEDRKGRSVVVQRTGSDEARRHNEAEAASFGPPRRPRRGYHGKRDLTPRDT